MDHPEVSFPEKPPKMSSGASENCLDHPRDNLKEKEMDEAVHHQYEMGDKLRKKLDII